MTMEKKETSKHIGDKSVQNTSDSVQSVPSSTSDTSKRIVRPTKFNQGESGRTDSVSQLNTDASASNKTSSVSIPSMNDSINALTKTLSISTSSSDQGQGQGDMVTKPPLSPDSFISSTCSGDIDSPTTSGPDTNPESESETSSTQMGVSGPSSPTSSATSSSMSIGPEYAHTSSYPQPSVRPKEHRNATWPEGLTSSSVSAGISTQQRHNSNSEGTSVTSSPTTISPSSSRSSFASSAIPPIDPTALADLEKHSKRVADSLDLMMGHLNSTLHNMSAISVGHVQTYRDAVEKAGLTVDQSVKAMYALIAKCEELSRTMVPVQDLAKQIKSIKKQLDELEAVCK